MTTDYIKLAGKIVAVEIVDWDATAPSGRTVRVMRHPTGSKTVRLLADCGAYRIGDKINVGPGQFIKDE